MSLKVPPESAVLWLDEKSPYSKVEVKSSKHSHDALWSKKKKKETVIIKIILLLNGAL